MRQHKVATIADTDTNNPLIDADQNNKLVGMSKEAYEVVVARANSWTAGRPGSLANAIMLEHPTLSGQLGRVVALGICRRVMRDEEFKGGWPVMDGPDSPMKCRERISDGLRDHPVHDGRWSCHLVIGAFEMTLQSYT